MRSKKLLIISRLRRAVFLTTTLFFAVGLITFAFPQQPANAVANSIIGFQSKIVDKTTGLNVVNGTPACVASGSDTCDFRVSIYTDPSSGTLLWREPHANVEIGATGGYFNLQLNSVCTSWTAPGGSCSGTGIIWGSDSTVYIQIEMDTDGDGDFATGGADTLETFARKLFTSVPYAYYADNANSASSINGFTDTDFVKFAPGSGQTTSSTNGLINLTTTGNVTNPLIFINENGAGTPLLMNLQVGGVVKFNMGNDGSISAGTGLHSNSQIYSVSSLTSGTRYGVHSELNLSGNNLAGNGIGLYGNVSANPGGGNIIGSVSGTTNNASLNGSGTVLSLAGTDNIASVITGNVTNVYGSNNTINVIAAGTASNAYALNAALTLSGVGAQNVIKGVGLNVASFTKSVSSTFTDAYGIFIATQTAATNNYGLYIENAGTYAIWSDAGVNRFDGNILAGTPINTAFLTVAPATTGQSSLRLVTSSGTDPSSPNSGDLWWNGTRLNFRTGSTTIDLLTEGGCPISCVAFSSGVAQTSTDTDGLINIATTGTVSVPLINVNENGSGTPVLLDLQVAGATRLALTNAGQLQLAVTGNTGGLLIGGDGNLYRGAANRLDTDDSFSIADNLFVGSVTETLSNTGFVLDGDDAFIAGMMGVEGNIYTDGSFIAGATLTLSDGSITQSTTGTGNLTISTSGGSAGLLGLTGNTRINFTAGTASANTTNAAFNFQASNNLAASDELFQIGDSASGTLFTLYGSGNLGLGTTTNTASLNVAASSSTQASMRLISSSGTNPSSPNSGDLWWNGTNLNFYNGTTVDLLAGGTGKVDFATGITQTSSSTNGLINLSTTGNLINTLVIVNENGAGTPALMDLQVAGTSRLLLSNAGQLYLAATGSSAGLVIGGDANLYRDAADVLRSGDGFVADVGVSAGTTTATAFINAAAATGVKASLRLISSATIDVASPNSGDLWWNGTNLYFNNGVSNRDLLAGLNITTKSIQTSTVLCSITLASNGYFDTDNDCGGLSNTYTHLEINYKTRASSAASADLSYIIFNNDTTASNYGSNINYTTAGTVSPYTTNEPIITYSADTALPANSFSTGKITILNYRDSKNKVARSEFGYLFSLSQTIIGYGGVVWENNAAITRVSFRPDTYPTDSFVTGSTFELVGIKEETVVTNVTSGGSGGTAPLAVSTGSTLTGLDILYTSSGTTADAIKIANNTTGVITDALDVSDAEIVNAINLGVNNIVQDDGGTVNWNDSAGNNLIQITDIATNFGASVEAGAMVSRNSYFGDEFSRERADLTADTTQGWGDDQAWTVDELTPTTNDCTWSIVDDAVNGISRMAISTLATSTACSMYNGRAVGTAHLTQLAANLPLVIMKLRPSHTGSANDTIRAGLVSTTTPDNNEPANGIYFNNNGGSTWTGTTRSGGTSTNVTCTGQTISTSQFALLKIEVRSTTDVRFYVDTDVSNGVSWFYCGSSATNVPSAGLTQSVRLHSTTNGRSVDVDYFRNWSDDNVDIVLPSTEQNPVEESQPEEDESITDEPVNEGEEQVAEDVPEQPLVFKEGMNVVVGSVQIEEIRFTSARTVTLGDALIYGKLELQGDIFALGNLHLSGSLYMSAEFTGRQLMTYDSAELSIVYAQARSQVPNLIISLEDSSFDYRVIENTETGFKVEVIFVEMDPLQKVYLSWITVQNIPTVPELE